MQALSIDPLYFTLNPQSAVLRVNPAFIPKTLTDIALNAEIEIQAFYPNPANAVERAMALNCPIRALSFYKKQTHLLRKSSCLFVSYHTRAYGKQVSKRIIAGWLSKVITDAYLAMGRDLPRSNAHSLRKVSSSWKEFTGASASQIVKAGTWTSLQTFATFYRLDFASVPAQVGGDMLHAAMSSTAHSH